MSVLLDLDTDLRFLSITTSDHRWRQIMTRTVKLSGVHSVYQNQKRLINCNSTAQLINVTLGDNADLTFCSIMGTSVL